jgi:hypothetical protein
MIKLYKKQELRTLRDQLSSPRFLVGPVAHLFNFLSHYSDVNQ